jgi:hypothetical protein
MTTRSNAAAPARRGDAGPATRTVAGIGLMVLAILLFTVMDTLGKDLLKGSQTGNLGRGACGKRH